MFERRSELQRLVAVAEAGKIVDAAHRLGMTQPALTRAIAALETRFGAPLFERLPTGVRPTALGVVAAEQARRLLRAHEEVEDRIGGVVAGRHGCIRATAEVPWMETVLPEAVGRFRERFPAIELRLRGAGRAEGLRLLEAGDSELHCGGIDDGECLPDQLRHEPLPPVTLGIVARPDHPLLAAGAAGAAGAAAAALADWPWVDCATDTEPKAGASSLDGLLDELHARTGRRPASAVRAGMAGLALLASGPYLARLPLELIGRLPGRALSPLPLEFGRRRRGAGLALRRSAESLAPVRLLRDLLREAAWRR